MCSSLCIAFSERFQNHPIRTVFHPSSLKCVHGLAPLYTGFSTFPSSFLPSQPLGNPPWLFLFPNAMIVLILTTIVRFPSSVISKVFEIVISDNLHSFLKHEGLPSNRQYGFQSRRSTDNLLAFVSPHFWSVLLDNYGETNALAWHF